MNSRSCDQAHLQSATIITDYRARINYEKASGSQKQYKIIREKIQFNCS